jgi:hypothetical protein
MNWHGIFFRFAATYSCIFSTGNIFGQLNPQDSNFYQSALSGTINLYNHSSGDQSELFNGILYPGYPFLFKSGSPFFDSSRSDTGTVLYAGILFSQLPLIYENLKDLVIINDNGYFIQLNNKKLTEFTFAGHHFIHLAENNKAGKNAITGFYEILYDGNIKVLKKTRKQIEDDLSSDNIVEKFITQSDYYFIQTESNFYEIKSKKDIHAIFTNKWKEIKLFIRRNQLKIKEDKGNTLVQITAYYERLRNQL